jgi:hypothetical protein
VPRPKEGTTYRFACDPHSGIMHGSFQGLLSCDHRRGRRSRPSNQRRALAVLRYLQQHECVPSRAGRQRQGGRHGANARPPPTPSLETAKSPGPFAADPRGDMHR